ncbi:MAG TPA: DUF1993 family protein [Myxococcota bacterium]|jgi:hypothetical protein|nr:DUF1993 family protein [Myxococcota bacterium]
MTLCAIFLEMAPVRAQSACRAGKESRRSRLTTSSSTRSRTSFSTVRTAYAILRHNGVDVGNRDFLGPLTLR